MQTTTTDAAIVAQRDAALSYVATEWAAQSYVAALAGMGVRDNGHGMPASWAVADCPWDRDTCAEHPHAVPTVEITRMSYFLPPVVDIFSDDALEWEPVNDGTTDSETFDPAWDTEDYGTPVVWAAARIRDLSCDHNLEPSVYPLPVSVPERAWLAASYENPYVTERVETSARVYGISDTDRAEIFRLAMLPRAEWVALLHAHRYPDAA